MIGALPRHEGLVIPRILAGGVLQLVLCITGQVDVGLLVCVYAAEAIVLVPYFRDDDTWETFKGRMSLVVLCLAAGLIAASNTEWTGQTVLVACALWLVTVGTWCWEGWERRVPPWQVVTRGPALLHMGTVVVGLLGLLWAHEQKLLVRHGWPGTGTGTGAEAGDDAGVRLVTALVESGVAPLTVPALALVVFRTMNEVFLELYRQLGSTSAASSSDAPSSSRTTA